MQKRKEITKCDIAIVLHNNGYSREQIRKVLNVSQPRVSQYLIAAGYKKKPWRITKEQVDLIEQAFKQGATPVSIAKQLGASNVTVLKHLKSRGYVVGNAVTPQEERMMQEYRENGMYIKEIAKLLGRNEQTVSKHLKQINKGDADYVKI